MKQSTATSPVQWQGAMSATSYRSRAWAVLPNLINDLMQKGTGEATETLKRYPPEQGYDGTRVYVSIEPVEGAKEYQVWVSAYPDGRGAQALVKTAETDTLVSGLRPEVPLYFFVTYTDAEGKASKPSAVRQTTLKDEFPMK